MQSRVRTRARARDTCLCVMRTRAGALASALSRHRLSSSVPAPSRGALVVPPVPRPRGVARWKSVAERMRKIAAAEDRRSRDEPPAKLIPSSLGFAPGT